ncbi:hypothetical protein FAM22280_02294 [Lacticaseibacillus paracasei]|nr:hypothetical protein FAM22280_02294 [Lacticaseibacillus paracasei]
MGKPISHTLKKKVHAFVCGRCINDDHGLCGSCVILVAALTRLVKASTRLLLAVAEFQQALDKVREK